MRLDVIPGADQPPSNVPTTQPSPGHAYHVVSPTVSYTPAPTGMRMGARPHSISGMPWVIDRSSPLVFAGHAETSDISPLILPISLDGLNNSQMESSPAGSGTQEPDSEPPPLNHEKSLYKCIPLPEVVRGPVMLNPALTYTTPTFNLANLHPTPTPQADIDAGYHLCAPATNPSLGSMVVILPSGRPITVHPSTRNVHVVTVGDVLKAIDRSLMAKSDEIFDQTPPVDLDANGDEVCPCLGGWTTMEYLRSRYRMAGLVRSGMGFDIWKLQITI